MRKVDAERWEAEQRVAAARGTYLTADEMRVTLGQYVETHIGRQVRCGRTVELARLALARAEDYFGSDRPLTAIRRGDVEAFIVKQSKTFAAGTVHPTFQHFRSIMRSALADGLIAVDPTMKIKLPKVTSELVVLPPADVHALIAAAPPASFRAAVILGA